LKGIAMRNYRLSQWSLAVIAALLFVVVFASPQQVRAQCFASGDINADGVALTVADLVYLIRYLSCDISTLPLPYEADLNGDCFIDYADAEMYQCYFNNGLSCFNSVGGYPVPTCCNPSDIRGPCESGGECYPRSEANCLALGGLYWGNSPDCDIDDDALPDLWECGGYDDNGDGIIDVDLPAMGANPLRMDIFVEIDWMGPSGSHDHQPDVNALNRIVAGFATAPNINPDGTSGINLHIDYGQGGLWTGGNQVPHDNNLSNPPWPKFDAIKATNFAVEREKIFHYCLYAHDFLGSTSGISRGIQASDFVVSLGSWRNSRGTEMQQAGTFMHELGHNLGLRHGGNTDVNYKPNYLSVMRYGLQMSGMRISNTWGHYDYSRWNLPDLNETCLNETIGLNGPSAIDNYGTRYYCTGTTSAQKTHDGVNNGIDWNCDNDTIDACVNGSINRDAPVSTLTGYEDWTNLVYDGGSIGLLVSGAAARTPADTIPEELTWEEYQEICIRRGDANDSGDMNVGDLTYLVDYLFGGGPEPATLPDGDPDGSESIDVGDITYLVNWLFLEGQEPFCY
jgi:hypothetical protein